MVEAACQEVGDGLVDLGADPRHGRTANACLVAQGAHQLVDFTGGTPSIQAWQITTYRALSTLLRGDSREGGKNDPSLNLGIASSTSPASVASVLGRVPLRRVARSGIRSCGAAPILAVASALVRSCSPACSIRQNTSEWARPGSVRTSWISADTADWPMGHRGITSLLLAGNNRGLPQWPLFTSPTTNHQREVTPR